MCLEFLHKGGLNDMRHPETQDRIHKWLGVDHTYLDGNLKPRPRLIDTFHDLQVHGFVSFKRRNWKRRLGSTISKVSKHPKAQEIDGNGGQAQGGVSASVCDQHEAAVRLDLLQPGNPIRYECVQIPCQTSSS